MALWDSADLLARCQTMAKRPSLDEDMAAGVGTGGVAPGGWYSLLTEAQLYWTSVISQHWPQINWIATPELLTTADGGQTYTFAQVPLCGVEVRASRNGVLLRCGAEWDDSADFVVEPDGAGSLRLRTPSGRSRVYTNGPYARYVAVPGALDGANAPTMQPAHMRLLLVARACYLYATRGGERDPGPYLFEEQRLWAGDPNIEGDTGFMGELKMKFFGQGMSAIAADGSAWWQSPDFH